MSWKHIERREKYSRKDLKNTDVGKLFKKTYYQTYLAALILKA